MHQAKLDHRSHVRKAMQYAKDHGFTGAPELRKCDKIRDAIGPTAPLGTLLHSATFLRLLGSPNFLPSRVKPDVLFKDDGETWLLQFWIHKPSRIAKNVDLKKGDDNKLTWEDTEKDQIDTVFTTDNMLISAAWRRALAMLNTAIPDSQGFVKPTLWGMLLDYTFFLTQEAYLTDLDKLVAYDTELMTRRSLGQWDFDKTVPTDVVAMILVKKAKKNMRCSFCEASRHGVSECRFRKGKKDIPQKMLWDSYCRPWNFATEGQSPCTGSSCQSAHKCLGCDGAHPLSACEMAKKWAK